ncbi:MAG: PQQ-dependent sugar dehydrogenase [Luteitalea sp.]|nr:PQQ-dependent sugar dehydrogenase [Luteitalea sp.]
MKIGYLPHHVIQSKRAPIAWLTHLALVATLISGLTGCDGDSQPPREAQMFTARDGTRFAVEIVVGGLEVPWSLAFAPDGRLFFTERPGRVRIFAEGRLVAEPAFVVPDVASVGEGGLLGLALHPNFADNHFVYLAYTAGSAEGRTVNRLVRYREVGGRLGEAAVLLDNIGAASIHDGGRLRFGPDGKLYLTMGDAASPSRAQDLASRNGKILRVNDDGSRPDDNPFATLVFTWGHRNPQGLDWHPTTRVLLATEHGPTGNDEVNVIQAGRNYGWPVIQGSEQRPDMQTPIEVYTPSIAPSGASFYTASLIPSFRGDFFFATLRGEHLHRLRIDSANPRRVVLSESLMQGAFGRLRDVVTGPDGALYVATNNRDGRGSPVTDDDRILRLVPAQ